MLTILILHNLGDPLGWRAAVRDLEYLLPDHAPAHNYLVHPAEQPLPPFVKDLRFHAVILGPTFLCARYTPHGLASAREAYDFIGDSDAFKIALPQDDYDCSALLDRWMVDWRVDAVYPVIPDHWEVLYPQCAAAGRLHLGYTGYIADSWLQRFRDPKPARDRTIDVSYRARRLPPNFGRTGWLKGHIGELFEAHPATAGLRLDISTRDADLITGERWHDFIEDSKCCLATNSGSSLHDADGSIRACVERQLIKHPGASFEAIEERCFKGEDGRYLFAAISPRNIEAALARTVQLATPGPYSGILDANTHYLPLAPDCSNAADIVAMMGDAAITERVARQARDAVLAVPQLRATHHAARLIAQIEDGVSTRRIQASPAHEVQRVFERYRAEVTNTADAFWRRRRRRRRLRDAAVALGARKVKRWLMRD